MGKSRALRVSSTRDICIFCATRQFVAADVSPAFSQRRQLNSSSKAPQYASEGMMYKEQEVSAPTPSRPLTQAEKMQALLRARAPPPPPLSPTPPPPPRQTRINYTGAPQGGRTPFQSQGQPQRSQFQPQRQTQRPPMSEGRQNRGSMFNGPGRNQNNNRHSPAFNSTPGSQRQDSQVFRPARYNVNMDSRAGPAIESPAFGAGQLRRRHDPQNFGAPAAQGTQMQAPQQPRQRPKMNQAELEELLRSDSKLGPNGQPRQRTPLSRDANNRRSCMHCGSQDHSSLGCPSKPMLRQQTQHGPQSNFSRQRASITDAAEAFAQRRAAQFENSQHSSGSVEEKRWNENERDRRPSRFRKDEDEEPVETRNRYEEPERRRTGDYARADRNRVMRHNNEDEDDDYVGKAERKRRRAEAKRKMQEAKGPTPVNIPEYISVANLATLLKVRLEDFVAKLEELGFEEVQSDHILNAEHAGLVAQEYNFEPVMQTEENDGDLHPAPALSPEEYASLPARPPVVTIMGHVDHGKTTILDYLRSTSVAAGEFGGITQHIGAFSVPLSSGKTITFLDTPGHSAFETMRARGANVTDIVVLVVAADDSVMPQTVEAIKHAQAAKVPMIVAINKIDKSQANPDAVKLDLGRHGIEVEDFGGDVQAVCVSGKTGQGIPDLEEAITTLSEMLDHRADPEANVEGWVLEGTTKKSGRVATVLVRSGTLRRGDILVAGNTWARVRSLCNETGAMVEEVGPGMPVEVHGWREQPIAGDEVLQAADEQQAQAVSELRVEKLEREQMAKDMDAINSSRRLEAERRQAEEAAATEGDPAKEVTKESGPDLIPFIIKGDVSGSVEAVIDSISALGNNEVGTRILRHGVGSPSEFDVQHAADAHGHIVNFNTPISGAIAAMAERQGVKILDSNIIYRVVENVRLMLEEKLPPTVVTRVTGEAEVAMTFEIGLGGRKKMVIAGSKVRNGEVRKGCRAKVLRKEKVVHDGIIGSLKSHKKDVQEMRKDTECGIAFEDAWSEFKAGDKIQCYEEEEVKRSL